LVIPAFSGLGLVLVACRVPPRRAGNFLLVAQKKVTKEEGLNTIWPNIEVAKSSPLGGVEVTPDAGALGGSPLRGVMGSLVLESFVRGPPSRTENHDAAQRPSLVEVMVR